MSKLTRAQREALKRIYNRTFDSVTNSFPCSYLAFRRTVVQSIDCIMVPFAGMWVGVELDGYCHT